jgi:predicted Zn-dependent peptidase
LIVKTKLGNGLTLMTERIPHVQSVAIGVWTLAGSVDEASSGALVGARTGSSIDSDDLQYGAADAKASAEAPEDPRDLPDAAGAVIHTGAPAGISHLIEHMFFKGTKSRTAKEIAEISDRMGGLMNAFTGKEATCYYMKTLSEHLNRAMELIGDIFLNSIFDEVELTKEKNVIFEEMNMIEDSPEDLGHDLLDEIVFAGSPLGNRIIGCKESVGAAGVDTIQNYIAERYVAGNVVISVVGNFETADVIRQAEACFGAAPQGRSSRSATISEHSPRYTNRVKDIEQSHIFLGRRGVKFLSEDYYAFMLFNSILGGSMSSRLFQSIREEKGLAYSVYSTSSSFVNDGAFMIYAGVSEGRERVTIDAIREETERLASESVEADELLKVKEQSKGVYVFGRENVQTRMFAAGRNELLIGRVFEPEEIIAGIESVTPEDISRVARECADISKYSAVIIGKNEVTREAAGM